MQVFYFFLCLEFSLLIHFPQNKILILPNRYQIWEFKSQTPNNRIMSWKNLRTDKVIILHFPNSNTVIIATANHFFIWYPVHIFHILCMTFKHIFTHILSWNGVKFPNPDVFIATTWSNFFVVWTPIYTFYLIFMTLHCWQEFIWSLVQNPNW